MPTFVYPESVTWEEHTDHYGRLVVAPLERGYATTLGNSLRRVLLSSLPGAAVVRVLFPGHFHEYDTIEGVREDILAITLNLKGLAIRTRDEALHRLYLNVEGPREVHARDIETPAGVEIVNPDHYIATLDKGGRLELEMEVETGRGFRPAEDNKREDAPLALIPVDADFSPTERVNFTVEETRVGGRSGYERLVLEVWTNGTISPQGAVERAVDILSKHLSLLVGVKAAAEETAAKAVPEELLRPLVELGFEVRACNLLREEGVITLGDLLARTREELYDIHGFGEKTLARVEKRLSELGHALRSEKEV
ncbi:MAG: DNA-directed RNA polymerase subunit alpha [Candidatus Acetothermia bacterium]|jgi:DNA-directed RNA polymerase subunit alpha|nr:DNA-directed RNA polymerase subunit alpha [Candidatus Acetothermia bacterium]